MKQRFLNIVEAAGWLLCLYLFVSLVPPHAQSSCVDVAGPKAAIEAKHGKWITVTTDQWEFLRGVYVLNPNTAPGLPPGDRAVLAELAGDDGAVIFFIDGATACTPMPIPAALVKMLREIDASNVAHQGSPS